MATHLARIHEQREMPVQARSAEIIRFPAPARVQQVPSETPRPESGSDSLGLSIVLAIILILACVLWETMSMPSNVNDIAGRSAITSPRADIGMIGGCGPAGLA